MPRVIPHVQACGSRTDPDIAVSRRFPCKYISREIIQHPETYPSPSRRSEADDSIGILHRLALHITDQEMATKECLRGITWDGTPTGKETSIAGLDTYISRPTSGPVTSAIVLISDIFGWKAKNARLFADKVASEGYIAILPDLLHGKALEVGFDRSVLKDWQAQFPRDKVLADCITIVEEVKLQHGISSVGVQGLCWGGLYAVLLAGTTHVSAAVVAHPSYVTKEDVEAIQQPALFLAPGNDAAFPDKFREEVDQVMRAKELGGEVIYYPKATHGWTIRGDLSDPQVKDDVNDAYERAILFFAIHVPRA